MSDIRDLSWVRETPWQALDRRVGCQRSRADTYLWEQDIFANKKTDSLVSRKGCQDRTYIWRWVCLQVGRKAGSTSHLILELGPNR